MLSVHQILAVILRELIILKRKFWRYFFSFTISPLLYFITFGWGGKTAGNKMDYSTFILPGLIAMSAMINSYGLSTEINIARFYWKTFDEIRTAPVADWAYVAGEIASAIVRGFLAACIVVAMGILFRVPIILSPMLLLGILITTIVFSALAIITAILARSHADQGMLSNFVITPMAFLCGTFFPVEAYPSWLRWFIKALPLTPASQIIRAAAAGQKLPGVALAYFAALAVIFISAALLVIRRVQD
jgi:ABC-2 type transport system permease protein